VLQVGGAPRRRREALEALGALVERCGECRVVVEGAPLSAVRQWEDAARGAAPGVWERAEQEVARRVAAKAAAAAAATAVTS
jgi:hypothetical protein